MKEEKQDAHNIDNDINSKYEADILKSKEIMNN